MTTQDQEVCVALGSHFGKWTVVGDVRIKHRQQHWLCRCECGTTAEVKAWSLRTGNSTRCVNCARRTQRRHGEHGYAGRPTTAEYRIWKGMRDRCRRPTCLAYKYYGARGIRVCDRWNGKDGFENFLADMGRRPSTKHSIDRIDVNGNYEPSNCRWATWTQQNNNKRNSKRAPASEAA